MSSRESTTSKDAAGAKAYDTPEEPMAPTLIALLFALASCFFLGSAVCGLVYLQNRTPAWLVNWEEQHREVAGFAEDFTAYQQQQTQRQQLEPSWLKTTRNPVGFLIAAVGLLCASVGTFLLGHWQRTLFHGRHERWIWSLSQPDRASAMQRAGMQAIAASMGSIGFDRLSVLSSI
jgi:hypothetical protein